MKRIAVLVAVAVVLMAAGCDIFGSDETYAFITGTIYADAAHTTPLEGAFVEFYGDSTTAYCQTVQTDANGVFFMDVQFNPVLNEEGTGYVLDEFIFFGLSAHLGTTTYTYYDIQGDPGYLGANDTLVVWDIHLLPTL